MEEKKFASDLSYEHYLSFCEEKQIASISENDFNKRVLNMFMEMCGHLCNDYRDIHSDVWNNCIIGFAPLSSGPLMILGQDYDEYEYAMSMIIGDEDAKKLVVGLREHHEKQFKGDD